MRLLILVVTFMWMFSMNSTAQNGEKLNWKTRFELSGYLETGTYDETMKYFERLAEHSPYAKFKSFGISPQGRALNVLIVASGGEFNPLKAKSSGKAIVLIQNGIHSGEIEGKDASMILLREILVENKHVDWLNDVILLVVPIFNVDGHERRSKYNRINQNGPAEMGWRVTAQNLNLNRDYTKADAPEMKAMLKLFSDWLPDFYIDTHTTDGADYQYTITYDIVDAPFVSPESRKWIEQKFKPFIESKVQTDGFLIGPYVGFVNGNPKEGLRSWVAGPRFSQGYAAVQNRRGLLVETHMLKPYKDRVFATYSLLKAVLELVSNQSKTLRELNILADEFTKQRYVKQRNAYPISFEIDMNKFSNFEFKGYKAYYDSSWIAGKPVIKYSHEKENFVTKFYNRPVVKDSVFLPEFYLIPEEWSAIVPIIELHGIKVDTMRKTMPVNVEIYKFKKVKFPEFPYEGRFSPAFQYDVLKKKITIPAGTFVVSTNQRNAGLIAHLLEPASRDSFLKWGFFNIIFERKEYFEMYSMEPIAKEMLEHNEKLKEEFLKKLQEDENFRNNAWQRLNFFYERSPYYDKKHNIYPVMRVPFE